MSGVLEFDLRDVDRFHAALGRMEYIPQKTVTRAAGKGTTVVRKRLRQSVPVDTGELRRGIVRRAERSSRKGKKVYDLMFDPAKNDIFQKPIKNPGQFGGKNPKAYYPASMEYGFLTRSTGGGYSYVPGYHFMREAAEDSYGEAMQVMADTMTTELEKEWVK